MIEKCQTRSKFADFNQNTTKSAHKKAEQTIKKGQNKTIENHLPFLQDGRALQISMTTQKNGIIRDMRKLKNVSQVILTYFWQKQACNFTQNSVKRWKIHKKNNKNPLTAPTKNQKQQYNSMIHGKPF